jgi:hypothetical protein
VHGRGNAGEDVDLGIPALSAADAARLRPLDAAVGARTPAHLAAEWLVQVPSGASAEVVAAAAALVQISECLVRLHCKGLSAADARVLCAALEGADGGAPAVSELALQGDKGGHLGGEGAEPVAEVLKVNATLTTLWLQGNQIGDAGAIGLGKALEVNATLTTLNLYRNQIGDEGAIGLGKALAVNATLTTLNLSGSVFSRGNIGDEGAIALGKALEVNATLTALYLSANQIGDSGAIGLGEALSVNATLTTLNLSWNQIGDSGAIGLGEGLKVNETLTKLELEYNNIGDASKSAFRTAWQSKTGRQSGLLI